MSEEKNPMSKKKKILSVALVILGLLIVLRVSISVFVEPKTIHPVDGKAGMMRALEDAKKRKDKQIEDIRSRSPNYEDSNNDVNKK